MKFDTFEDRTHAAAGADVVAAAQALGIPLVRKGFNYVLRDYQDVIVTKHGWKHTAGKPGQAGMFTCGNAIHLAIEYADKGYRDAVEAITAALWPSEVPQSSVKEEDRIPFSRKVARIRIEKELEGGEAGEEFDLPEPTARQADHRRCEEWFARKGIDPSIVHPLLARGIFYCRPRANVIVFPSAGAENTPNGAYVINKAKTESHQVLDGTSPVAKWFVPGGGTQVHVYQNPLDLLADMEIERRNGKLHSVPRLALFPGRPKALLHYVLQSGMNEAVLHLPEYSEDMLSAPEIAESVKTYINVRTEKIPSSSLADALAPVGR